MSKFTEIAEAFKLAYRDSQLSESVADLKTVTDNLFLDSVTFLDLSLAYIDILQGGEDEDDQPEDEDDQPEDDEKEYSSFGRDEKLDVYYNSYYTIYQDPAKDRLLNSLLRSLAKSNLKRDNLDE